MSKIKVVPFELSHVDEVLILEKLCFSIPWSKASFTNEISKNELSRYVVAILDGKVMGYGGMWLIAGEAHITNIAVHPDFRTRGAACSILDELLSICKKESISCMTLEVRESNTPAINLYKKYGFLKEGMRPGYYEDNKENAIIMWKHEI